MAMLFNSTVVYHVMQYVLVDAISLMQLNVLVNVLMVFQETNVLHHAQEIV